MRFPERTNRQYGFSLVEVLVAAIVFALGLGGLSLLLLASVHGSVEAQDQTAAAMEAAALAELVALNPPSAGYFLNTTAEITSSCIAAEACTGAAWAESNLASWNRQLRRILPHATGVVCLDATPQDGVAANPACDGEGGAVVKVFWVESRHLHDQDGGLRRMVLPVAK